MDINLIQRFKNYYSHYDQYTVDELDFIYSEQVIFTDPIHKITGLKELKAYFQAMCANLTECRFEFLSELATEDSACFKWLMHYRHPSIAKNKPLKLEGVTIIKFADGKVTAHEDFYDMGAMLYEQLPVLGSAIRMIKSRVAG